MSLILRTPILTNGDMSQSTVVSIGIDSNQHDIGSIVAVWTGAPVGSLQLQISDDDVPVAIGLNPAANVINWVTWTASITTVNGPGNFGWNIQAMGFYWVRLVYTKTSGTGSISATLVGKGQ